MEKYQRECASVGHVFRMVYY